jgi:tetratricopeptide (TPR) repeat protein
VLAEKGLNAARAYAAIAPVSAHANHMPSHIFTRVGSWEESIASNRRSRDLAAQAEASSKNGEARDQRLHAMDYLEYAYLESGRVQQAHAVWDEMNSFSPVPGITLTGYYANAAIPARYLMELSKWDEAGKLPAPTDGEPWTEAITWMAIGVGSARSGNLNRATDAEQRLVVLRDAIAQQNNTYWSNQVEVQRREVAAWIAHANGRSEEALSSLRSAADLEESMDKHAVTPGPVVPAREMLAELLLIQKHPQESLTEYQAALKLAPNRFNALYGAANAADAAGQSDLAMGYFRNLTNVATGDERPELVTARKRLATVASR